MMAERHTCKCGVATGSKKYLANRASGAGDSLSFDEQAQTIPLRAAIKVDKVEGAVLVDQLKSLDWAGRQAQFHSKAEPALLTKVRQYISVLLGIR